MEFIKKLTRDEMKNIRGGGAYLHCQTPNGNEFWYREDTTLDPDKECQAINKPLILILFLSLFGCESLDQNKISIPPEIERVQNLEVYTPDQNPDTVMFTKVTSYGDREELFFRSMGDFTVDSLGRVYIADAASGSKVIQVFSSDGDHIASLGGEGRGPREFIGLCCLQIAYDELFVYDNQQFKMNVYSIDTFEYSRSVILNTTEFNIPDKTKTFSHEYYFLTDSTYLIGFSENPNPANKGGRKFSDYYIADESWNITSNKLFEQLQIKEVWGEFQGTRIFRRFPFFKKSLLAVSSRGYIYRARTDDFLLKKYNSEGEYIEAFYYPYQKQEVSREDAFHSANIMSENLAETMELPEYWPVLNSMQFDDEDRLWVTTITDSKEKLKWWVLDRSGKLLATFMWPGSRAEQAYGLKEDVVVKNGYFYTRQENPETSTDEIIKYKIQFRER